MSSTAFSLNNWTPPQLWTFTPIMTPPPNSINKTLNHNWKQINSYLLQIEPQLRQQNPTPLLFLLQIIIINWFSFALKFRIETTWFGKAPRTTRSSSTSISRLSSTTTSKNSFSPTNQALPSSADSLSSAPALPPLSPFSSSARSHHKTQRYLDCVEPSLSPL